jgi:hypothetical protein
MTTTSFSMWLSDQVAATGLTRVAFAKKIGVSVAALYAWCNGTHCNIRPYNLARIAKGLGLSREIVIQQFSECSQAFASTPLHGDTCCPAASSAPLPSAASPAGA